MSDVPFLEPRGLPLRIAAAAWRAAHTGLAELLAPIARFLLAAIRLNIITSVVWRLQGSVVQTGATETNSTSTTSRSP